MEFENDFKLSSLRYNRGESLANCYQFGSGSLESLETRVPEDVNDNQSHLSLKGYLSQIKSLKSSKAFDLNPTSYDNIESIKPQEKVESKPLSKFERLQKLERSLNGIQSNVELKRSTILEDIYQKINNLENKINESELCSSQKIDFISKRIENVEKTIELVNRKHENVLKEKADAIDSICEKFHESLKKEQESWMVGEKNIMCSINEKIKSVKEEVSDMQKIKSEIMTNLKTYMDVDVPRFKAKLERANEEISNMEEKIINNTSDDLITLAHFIKEEYEQLSYLKERMMMQINKEISDIQSEVKQVQDGLKRMNIQECEEREDTQNRLMELMKETIKKLESPL